MCVNHSALLVVALMTTCMSLGPRPRVDVCQKSIETVSCRSVAGLLQLDLALTYIHYYGDTAIFGKYKNVLCGAPVACLPSVCIP
jgi:hypothetical protein